MTKLVIVTKGCDVKELDAKSVNEDELYKKCNYRKPTDFEMVTEWNVKIGSKKYKIRCYGKKVGKANMENKYDFPPPIDSTLLYGNCAIVRIEDDEIVDLTKGEWDKIYEKLFGGFEDLGGSEEDEKDKEMDVDELADVPKDKLTSNGYLKDGFVVDDEGSDEIESDESGSGSDDEDTDVTEDTDESTSPKSKTSVKKNVKLSTKKNKKLSVNVESSDSESYADPEYGSDVTDELSEDEYVYSDED